jgi:hypothetical protein
MNYWTLCTRSLPSARDLALDKYIFYFKMYFSSALDPALGKGFFAECPLGDTRQRLFHYTLSSVHTLTLGKGFFAECHFWTLDNKVHFYFFYFSNQTFCGMFLHYVDLHVPF